MLLLEDRKEEIENKEPKNLVGEVVLQLAKSYLVNLNDMVHTTKETWLWKEVHANSQVK